MLSAVRNKVNRRGLSTLTIEDGKMSSNLRNFRDRPLRAKDAGRQFQFAASLVEKAFGTSDAPDYPKIVRQRSAPTRKYLAGGVERNFVFDHISIAMEVVDAGHANYASVV